MVARPVPRGAAAGHSEKGVLPKTGRSRWARRAWSGNLLLARIVRWIDEGDVRRPDAVHLNERLLTAGPREVPMRRRNGDEAADRQLLARALIEFFADADEEDPGEHGDVLGGLVVVGRDLVIGRHLHPIDE